MENSGIFNTRKTKSCTGTKKNSMQSFWQAVTRSLEEMFTKLLNYCDSKGTYKKG